MSATSYTNDEIEAGVLEIVKSQVKGSESITPQTELASAGVDSLAMVRILVAIEAKYGVWLEGDDLGPRFSEDGEIHGSSGETDAGQPRWFTGLIWSSITLV